MYGVVREMRKDQAHWSAVVMAVQSMRMSERLADDSITSEALTDGEDFTAVNPGDALPGGTVDETVQIDTHCKSAICHDVKGEDIPMAKYPQPLCVVLPAAAFPVGSALITYAPMYHMGMQPIKAPPIRPFRRPTFSTSQKEKMTMPRVFAIP